MRILDRALTHVRRSVARAPADGALNHALSWLDSELRGDAIPARLRDAAGRLAALLPSRAEPSASTSGAQAGGELPRAEGPTVVALEDALTAIDARASARELPKDAAHAADVSTGACPFTGLRADGTAAAPVASVADAPQRATPEPAPPAREPGPDAPVAPAKARRKNKERLAGAQTVENTSARSATRPAPKQPRSRAQATRKKS